MQRLVDDCRRRGLAEIWGYVLLENRPMLELCRELGFTQHLMQDEPGTAQITLKQRRYWTPPHGSARALLLAEAARSHDGLLVAVTRDTQRASALEDELRL